MKQITQFFLEGESPTLMFNNMFDELKEVMYFKGAL